MLLSIYLFLCDYIDGQFWFQSTNYWTRTHYSKRQRFHMTSQNKYGCPFTDIFSLLLFPESTELTRPAAWVWWRSARQTEKPFSHCLGGGQRDPKLHQEPRNPGSEVTLDSLAAVRISPSGQKRINFITDFRTILSVQLKFPWISWTRQPLIK